MPVLNASLDEQYCLAHPDVVPGQYVAVTVSDTGTGMTPEVMQQAFEPFFSTKPEGKGTGLGLSMVYGLVKQSGGHVKIYSEVGDGTTIKLYLPRSHAAEDSYTPIDALPVRGGTETILVAEDDTAVRATVVDMLSGLGYRVLKASDAAAAWSVIDSGAHIDLLFTDVVMPGTLRSPELARRARERLPQLAVLFTSGYTENAIVHGGRLDAGVDLLGKPYTRESLARKIRQVLARQAEKNQANAIPQPAPAPAAGRRILLVDDEADVRDSCAELLRLLGHEVYTAHTGEAALPLLEHTPDILITDQKMPGMDGDTLARLARQALPQLRVVFASGFGEVPGIPDALQLTKPYGLPQLQALMAKLKEQATQ